MKPRGDFDDSQTTFIIRTSANLFPTFHFLLPTSYFLLPAS